MKPKVKKVTTIETDASGVTRASVLYDRKKAKEKKGSTWLAIPEEMALQGLDVGVKTIKSLRAAHRKSNRKKRDGWLMDLGPNMLKAASRGRKRIRVWRVLTGR